ncbi:phage replisome organizer protein [Lactococcus lactis]|uniref:phage replisome organizer protein n=1 Tax=Lactococcus lactis TaxID=1358 RepID=UPI003D14CEA3
MAQEKRYWWLKLPEDFFNQIEIKLLRKIAGGDTYTIIYQKMLLLSLKNGGLLYFEGFADKFAEEISLTIDEKLENVEVTLSFLQSKNLIVELDKMTFEMQKAKIMTGSETSGAERVRRHREKKKALQSNTNSVTSSQVGNVEKRRGDKRREEERREDKKREEETENLFDNYFQIFSEFTRGIKSQPRIDVMHAFSELLPEQRIEALTGAKNYILWYQNSGNDIKFSKNAAVFLKDMIFIDYQEIPEEQSGYDPDLGF